MRYYITMLLLFFTFWAIVADVIIACNSNHYWFLHHPYYHYRSSPPLSLLRSVTHSPYPHNRGPVRSHHYGWDHYNAQSVANFYSANDTLDTAVLCGYGRGSVIRLRIPVHHKRRHPHPLLVWDDSDVSGRRQSDNMDPAASRARRVIKRVSRETK